MGGSNNGGREGFRTVRRDERGFGAVRLLKKRTLLFRLLLAFSDRKSVV